MKRLLSYIILILNVHVALAELEPNQPKKGVIEGKILEKESQTPVEYASLVLFNTADSSMVSGVISGPGGYFSIDGIPEGSYYMVVHFVGYDKKNIENLEISKDQKEINLGIIDLNFSAVRLDEAIVIADKQAIEYKLDKKVINVSRDISSAGASAIDVLEKVPSVRVDINGNVELRGSTGFTVLVDGKPSVLQGSEALQQLPASTIENIEIITNPSAKYDPDGTAGIINVVTKKDKLKGFSGMIDLSAGTGDKYAADLYLNYRNRKINIFGGVEWNERNFPRSVSEQRITSSTDTTFFRSSSGKSAWMRGGVTFKGGMDVYLDQKTTLSFGGEYGDFGFGWDNFLEVNEFTDPPGNEKYRRDNNVFRWSRFYYSANTNFKHEFDDEGHELNIFAFYSRRDGEQRQDKQELDTDENYIPVNNDAFLLRSIEAGPSNQYRIEADYTKPILKNGRLEAGYQYRRSDEVETYQLEYYDYDNGQWVEDENYYKKSLFERNIHALYSTFAQEIKGFQYQVGLRGEYTYRNITVENTGESALVDRFDFFPTLHLSKKIAEKNQLMASYSRRIERPRGWYLEPFETYVDENTRRIGNPSLLPEYTGSFELGYLRTLKNGTFSAETYFRKTNNKITGVQYFEEESGLIYREYQNLNNDEALGAEISTIYDFTKWLNINVSGTYYHYRVEDLTGESSDYRTSNNWNARFITSFKMPTQTRIQLFFGYQSPSVTAQGRREASNYTDVTVRQDFLKNALSVTLKVSDIFGSRVRESFTQGDKLYIYERSVPESQIVTLTISYKLNNFKLAPNRVESDAGM